MKKVSADLRQVLTKPEMVSRLSARGSYPRVMTAAETEAFVRDQQQLWKPAMERIAGQTITARLAAKAGRGEGCVSAKRGITSFANSSAEVLLM